jgi:hypothetical protein
VYDHEQAIGQGHVSVAFVDPDGNVTAYEFTGGGELRQYDFGEGGLQVNVDDAGNLIVDGAAALGEAMHPLSAGVGNDGIADVNLTVFPGADNEAGFNAAADAFAAQIEANGGPSVGFPVGEGPTYRLLTCNCGDIANTLAAAAGAQGFANDMRPNAQFRRERRSERRGNTNLWTLSVVGANRITQ